MEHGKPTHFNLEKFLDAAQMLVDSDNVVGAIKMIDECVPAYYRKNGHDLIQQWKHNVWKRVATVADYASGETLNIQKEKCLDEFKATRFQILDQLVAHWNSQDRVCHIIDMGPGPMTSAIGLIENNRKFTYNPINIGKIPDHYFDRIKDVYLKKPDFHSIEIFISFECIEHMFHPDDVINFYHRENVNAEHVLISTPQGSLGGGWKRSNADLIAHIRDFTPKELLDLCQKHWPHMTWKFVDDHQMVSIGSRINA